MKLLLAFACLIAVSAAQTTDYPYSAYLDPNGYFLLKWDVRSIQGDIEMQFVVNATGWVSLLIASEDGSYADVIFGGYNDATTYGYYADMHCSLLPGPSHTAPVNDESPDLVFQDATYAAPYTTFTVKRSIYTGDKDDVAIRSTTYVTSCCIASFGRKFFVFDSVVKRKWNRNESDVLT